VRVERRDISRREVVEFYARYDRGKKGQTEHINFDSWPWNDPVGIDRHLRECKLKVGVLAAYRSWALCQLNLSDILKCAIVNHIFPGESQVLGEISPETISESKPQNNPGWWFPLSSGSDIDQGFALILRPALNSEYPAKWYVEDGSGRILALFQRIIRFGEATRTAWAYVGDVPDEQSRFMIEHPELAATRRP
jgi:hypothetical protein